MPSRSSLIAIASSLLLTLLSFSLLTVSPYTLAEKGQAAAAVSATASTPAQEPIWVVRAYYTDRLQVNRLASWLEPWEVHHDQGYVVVAVTPAQYQLLEKMGFQLVLEQDLTAQINRPLTFLPGQTSGIPGYPCYRTVEETLATAQDLVSAYPTLAAWVDIGDSWEKVTPGGNAGYDLFALRLTNQAKAGPKPKLFVMGAIHAREYAPAELVTRFAEYLLNQYNHDADATWLLDEHEIHLLFIANPDGRKFAETGLWWRKNTNGNYCSPTSNSRGADLNRNFSFQWGCCGGSSTSPCNETYRGPSAASEPETQAIQAYLQQEFPDQRQPDLSAAAPSTATGIFLDIHSYSQLVLWPWGFTADPAPNGAALQTLGRKLAYFNGYEPSQATDLYPTDGTTDDFAYGELGVAAYTFEVGTSFFEPCFNFNNIIYPSNLNALLYAARAARTPYLTPSGPDTLAITVSPATVPVGQTVQINATVDDRRYQPGATGSEATQNIQAAEFYVDLPPWAPGASALPLQPADGSFNQKAEAIVATLDTALLIPGRHTLYLRGRDAAGNWGAVSAAFLEVTAPLIPPQAAFAAPARALPGEAVTFQNLTTGSQPLSYQWDFGDNTGLSTQITPTHSYTLPGSYTVTLTASNPAGSSQAQQTLWVSPYRLQVTPSSAIQSGPASSTLSFQILVSNTGLADDSYQISINGLWPTTLAGVGPAQPMDQMINLPSGSSQWLTFQVEIPAQAPFGSQETSLLTFTSQNDPTLSLSVRLFSYAHWSFYLPWLQR